MLKAGKYEATLKSHGISENKSGGLQAAIIFEIEGEGTITYYGQFHENSKKYTIDNLITCGLVGDNPAGPLAVGKKFSITLKEDTGKDGKSRMNVQFINDLSQVRNTIDQKLAVTKLADLTGAVMAARAAKGSNDEIPF